MDIEQLAGTKLGNYEIESILGRGGMGVVYKARQLNLDRSVALKILPPTLSSDSSYVKRFEREARAIAALNHPNIVQIYDVGQEGQTYYYTMEFIDGASLDDILFQRGAVPLERAVRIVARTANALAYTHKRGIVHRDIKSSNIMIDALGIVKVTDFGLALQEKTRRMTVEGGIVGTPEYMSPEQASGETATALSDIYSLGVVFYELLTGRVPFEADTPLGVIRKIQTEEPAPPRSIKPEIPPGVEKIILKMMAKDPKKRHPNCRAILADLRRFRIREPISPPLPSIFSIRSLTERVGGILLLLAERIGRLTIWAKSPAKILGTPLLLAVIAISWSIAFGIWQPALPLPYAGILLLLAVITYLIKREKPTKTSEPDKPTKTEEETDLKLQVAILQNTVDSLANELRALQIAVQGSGFPDTVVFKSGTATKCEIVSETSDSVRVHTDMGTTEIPRNQIKSLIRAAPAEKKKASKPESEIEEIQRQKGELKSSTRGLRSFDDNNQEENARQELEKLGIPYNSEEFINRARRGDAAAVDLFLAAGMNPDVKDDYGRTALMFVPRKGYTDIVRLLIVRALLDKGADVNAKNENGNTPLLFAAMKGDTDIVKALLDKGADMNTRNERGKTALMYAASLAYLDIARVLLDRGADVNTKTKSGRTALKLAAGQNHTIVQLLKQAGAKE